MLQAMSYRKTLITVFIISIAGLLFSGYLSYYELFVPGGCSTAVISCGVKNVTIANLPACVYGFLMYLAVFLLTGLSLLRKRK